MTIDQTPHTPESISKLIYYARNHGNGNEYPHGSFGALQFNAHQDCVRRDIKAAVDPFPSLQRLCTHAEVAFGEALELVKSIAWEKTAPPVNKFLWNCLCLKESLNAVGLARSSGTSFEVDTHPNPSITFKTSPAAPTLYWPKAVGTIFWWVSGNSALDVAIEFATEIYHATSIRLYHHPIDGCSFKFKYDNADQAGDLIYEPSAGSSNEELNFWEVEPNPVPLFVSWRNAVIDKLKAEENLPLTDQQEWKIDRDSQTLLSKIEDEYKRAISAIKKAEDPENEPLVQGIPLRRIAEYVAGAPHGPSPSKGDDLLKRWRGRRDRKNFPKPLKRGKRGGGAALYDPIAVLKHAQAYEDLEPDVDIEGLKRTLLNIAE